MAKKVWISLPLLTTTDLADATVVGFLKGGQKKELEVETAAFVTKWLMDKSIPFGIDFESATVDRNLVLDALPKRLQKVLGYPAPAGPDAGGVPQAAAAPPIEAAGIEPPSQKLEQTVGSEQAPPEATPPDTPADDAVAGGPSEVA
jgi:hypothetical protein